MYYSSHKEHLVYVFLYLYTYNSYTYKVMRHQSVPCL